MTNISCDEIDETNVEEIMKKIRDNVKRRYGVDFENFREMNSETNSFSCVDVDKDYLGEDFGNIDSNWDISNNDYHISSHRPIIGRFLVGGRNLVHGEVKRYVDPIFIKQNRLNEMLQKYVKCTLPKLSEFKTKSNEFETRIYELEADFSKFNNLENKLSEFGSEINKLRSNIEEFESRISNNFKEKLNVNETRIDELKTYFDKIIELENKLIELDSRIDNFESNIKEFESSISNKLENRLDNLESKLEENMSSKMLSSWAELYSKEVTEQDLINNIQHHDYFIRLVKKCSEKSAEGRVPRIIEVGLGNGTMSIYFSRDCYYDVYGIDNDIQVLEHNNNINKNLGGYAKFMLIDAFDLGIFKNKFFDVAYSQGTLEHFDNDSIIQLISKQLIVSKYVIFSVPSLNWPTRELGNERKMSLEEWETILKNSGFNIVNLEYYKDDLHIVGVVTD